MDFFLSKFFFKESAPEIIENQAEEPEVEDFSNSPYQTLWNSHKPNLNTALICKCARCAKVLELQMNQ